MSNLISYNPARAPRLRTFSRRYPSPWECLRVARDALLPGRYSILHGGKLFPFTVLDLGNDLDFEMDLAHFEELQRIWPNGDFSHTESRDP